MSEKRSKALFILPKNDLQRRQALWNDFGF